MIGTILEYWHKKNFMSLLDFLSNNYFKIDTLIDMCSVNDFEICVYLLSIRGSYPDHNSHIYDPINNWICDEKERFFCITSKIDYKNNKIGDEVMPGLLNLLHCFSNKYGYEELSRYIDPVYWDLMGFVGNEMNYEDSYILFEFLKSKKILISESNEVLNNFYEDYFGTKDIVKQKKIIKAINAIIETRK